MASTFSIEKNFIEADGIRIAYEDSGSGQPIVFIHGFPTSTHTWSRITRPLSDEYRCISFDLMGYGDSDKPLHESYSIMRQSDIIIAAMRQLDVRTPILAGHSMGGAISLDIARRLKSGVSGLFLADPACYMQTLPWFFQALRIPVIPGLILRRIPPRIAYWMVRDTAYHRKSKMKLEDMLGYILNVRKPGAAEAFISTARDIMSGNMDEIISSYPDLSMPVQIIWGRQDPVIPLKFGERLCRDIRNANLHVIENCRHTPQEEHPGEIYELFKSFLGKITAGITYSVSEKEPEALILSV